MPHPINGAAELLSGWNRYCRYSQDTQSKSKPMIEALKPLLTSVKFVPYIVPYGLVNLVIKGSMVT